MRLTYIKYSIFYEVNLTEDKTKGQTEYKYTK